MSKLVHSQAKTLKLINTLKYRCLLTEKDLGLNVIVEQMHSYIKLKGNHTISY